MELIHLAKDYQTKGITLLPLVRMMQKIILKMRPKKWLNLQNDSLNPFPIFMMKLKALQKTIKLPVHPVSMFLIKIYYAFIVTN